MIVDASGPQRVNGREIGWSIGAFNVRVRTNLSRLRDSAAFIYGRHPGTGTGTFVDFPVRVDGMDMGPRRIFRPRVTFQIGEQKPLYPAPRRHAPLLLESGINWAIGTEMHGYLLLHAAVVARGDQAAVLPAPSGSGKSTLAAGLMASGWRLLADEFAVIDPATGYVHPCLKAVSLKEAAIQLIGDRLPGEVLPEVYHTIRGRIGLLRPSAASAQAIHTPARIRWVISPQFAAGQALAVQRVPRCEAFITMASNTFNYNVLERRGFHALADAMSQADTYVLSHGDLDAAIAAVDRIAADG